MTSEEIILAIADNTLSVSRIKRIAKAVYAVDLSPAEIVTVTSESGIATPTRNAPDNLLLNDYPDQWSILLEARSFWVRVRRYWGDTAALKLQDTLVNAAVGRWRSLREQFDRYIHPQIFDRRDIDLHKPKILLPLELESFYDWDLQRGLYLQAFTQEFEANPQSQAGARFPLPSAKYKAFKQEKFVGDCLKAFDRDFGTEDALISYFADFWRTVYQNRSKAYFNNLKRALVGTIDKSLSQRSFYSATEGNFRHFLHNLSGFKTKAPWRIVLLEDPFMPLPMSLEGALLRYGWQRVQGMAAIGVIESITA